jgi:hypothetical protein
MDTSRPSLPSIVLCLLALAGTTGCGGGDDVTLGGSAGVRNGAIVGTVRGNGAQGVLPILGATVVAVRQEAPPITRSTQTDVNGEFVFSNLPVGRYRLGYSALGFASIPAQSTGAVDAYVESGAFVRVPPVILDATAGGGGFQGGGGGPANLIVTLLDSATGEPINNATVTAGVASISGAINGVYSLLVPASSSGPVPSPVGLSAQAEGYDPQSLTPREVGIVAGQLVTISARMGPFPVAISGRIRVPGGFEALLSTVEVRVNGISPSYTAANVNATTGSFRLTVPASTSTLQRVFTLTFVSPHFNLTVVSGVVAPQGGGLTLPADVVLTPIGVAVTGTVLTSLSQEPGAGSTVTIQELGRQVPIVGGTYSFASVPTGSRLTLAVAAFNALGGLETASVSIVPTTNGGTFVVPTIVTR